jgi:CheY-like chemotaxis protein
MDGDISLTSEYDKGSVFTAIIPQDIESNIAFAKVEDSDKKKTLIYERRLVYTDSLCWSLENMGVPYVKVMNPDDLTEALNREEWFYVFSGYGLYESIKPIMESIPEDKRPPLALMVESGVENYIPNTRFISLPMQSISIANVLNAKADLKNYLETSGSYTGIRFTFPEAKILVVDDISTNLKVAEGLLSPYKMTVDTSLSGRDAIEKTKYKEYDLIFMDHMMPDMDGIETTKAIRALDGSRFQDVPIIALTANAVSGMKEMFLENGFNDFLAKPIDISKLDETLDRWIPKSKRNNVVNTPVEESSTSTEEFPTIPGLDTKHGITMTGGTIAGYRLVLSMFSKDATERLPLLSSSLNSKDMPMFTTQGHALKSASGSIGAAESSAQAASLEAAGKAEDLTVINKMLPVFMEQLAELIKKIDENLIDKTATDSSIISNDEVDYNSVILPKLNKLKSAIELQNVGDIDNILDELNLQPLNSKIKEALEKISDDVLMTEFDDAIKTIEELISTSN